MGALAVLTELKTSRDDLDLSGVDACLASLPSLPPQGVLFGVASEGLPVMLDVLNPSPGPVLVLGDIGTGKTDLLRFVAAASARTHRPDQLQFCALARRPEEWAGFERLGNCFGIVSSENGAARRALGELVAFIQDDPDANPMLLLVDDPTGLDPAALDLFHWLLVHGPAASLWPLVTLNAELALELPSWLALFRTRIFGRIAQPELAAELATSTSLSAGPASDAALHNLLAGAQFCLRSEGHWLRFRVPSLVR